MASEQMSQSSRRIWRKSEEEALLHVMLEQISDKWTGDNGFRSGFFTLVAKELEKVLPGTNIKAKPHIDSKVKYWRGIYAKVYDIVNLSGFGWDNAAKRIVCDPNVWAEFEKANPKKAKEVDGKSFPYYDEWQTLFGKDRATGEGAEDPAQMAQADPQEDPTEEDLEREFLWPLFGDEFIANETTSSSTHATSTPPTSTHQPQMPTPTPHASLPTATPRASIPRNATAPANANGNGNGNANANANPNANPNAGTTKGRKRARLSEEDLALQKGMEVWMKESVAHMGTMASSMSFDKNLSSARKNVASELKKLDLTQEQRFKLSAVITKSEDRVDDFYGQDSFELQAWAEAVLDGKVYGPI